MKKEEALITVLMVIFLFHSLVISGILLYHTNRISDKMTGQATDAAAHIQLCVNSLPGMDLSNCSTNLTQNSAFACLVNASDADNNSIVFSSAFITNRTVFTISPLGFISFTPSDDDVGNHTANVSADDQVCQGYTSWRMFNFTVNNVNDQPFLSLTIPNQFVINNSQLRTFYLNDHFTDPDEDDLTYTSTLLSFFDIIILPNSQVAITAKICPIQEYVIFTAIDPSNATGDSNPVLLNCTIALGDLTQTEPQPAGAAGSGGGGGGGVTRCTPKLACFEWDECTKNGTQMKKCFDEKGCNDGITVIRRNCTYVEQCHNEVRDWNEEGLDCGGPCPPCSRCDDGIKNGLEEGVDCGGSCSPCVTSHLLVAEYVPMQGYIEGQINRSWNLTTFNLQEKSASILDHGLAEMPQGMFSENGTEVAYIKNRNIWLISEHLTRKITSDNDVLYLAMTRDAILYSRERFIEATLYPRLFFVDLPTLLIQKIETTQPAYHPASLMNHNLVAYATRSYLLDVNPKGFRRGFDGYVFGHVLLPEKSTIVLIDKNAEELLRVEDAGVDLMSPRFSPDGKSIAYMSYNGRQTDVWLVSTNGQERKQVTNTPLYNEIFPAFSRDSMHLFFSADYDGKYAIYSYDLESENISVLLGSANPVIGLDWYYSPSCWDGFRNQDETGLDCGGHCGSCGTCDDGIKNQNELGVDCGGLCEPCIEQATPGLLNQTLLRRILPYLFLIIAAGILIYVSRKKLHQGIRALHQQLVHVELRQIILDETTKKQLLKRLGELEKRQKEMLIKDVTLAYVLIAREYLGTVSGLGKEFDYALFEERLRKKKSSAALKALLTSYAKTLDTIEFGTKDLKDYELVDDLENLRLLILLTGPQDPLDLKREQHEKKPVTKDQDEHVECLLANISIALQFGEFVDAKLKYQELMDYYNKCSDEEKIRRFPDVQRAYTMIQYVSKIQ